MADDSTGVELSIEETAFVAAYCEIGGAAWGNATQAAKAAGYKCKTRHLYADMGYQVKRRPAVAAAIRQRCEEFQATADEALAYLTAVMRRDVSPYLRRIEIPLKDRTGAPILDGDGNAYIDRIAYDIDVARMRRDGLGFLIGSIRNDEWGPEFVLAGDPMAAADKILRASGRYQNKVEMSGPGGEPLKVLILDDDAAANL